MSRLTELYTDLEIEIHNGEPEARHLEKGDFRPKNNTLLSDCVQKLGQLEDIEDELGIDLIILFKAYSNGFYVKGEIEKQYIDFENSLNAIAFKNGEMFYGHKWSYQYIKLNEYGKTWALTKEELE